VEDEANLSIKDNPARSRYEAFIGSELAGWSEYESEPGRVVFTHTVVRSKFEGRGIGSRLAKTVIEDARDRGLRITPICPFVRAYLRRHRDNDSIVDYPPDDATD